VSWIKDQQLDASMYNAVYSSSCSY